MKKLSFIAILVFFLLVGAALADTQEDVHSNVIVSSTNILMTNYQATSVSQDSLATTVQGYSESTRSTGETSYQNNVTVGSGSMQNERLISGKKISSQEQTVGYWAGQFPKNLSQGLPYAATCTLVVTDNNVFAADTADIMSVNTNVFTGKSISMTNSIGADVTGAGLSRFYSGYNTMDGTVANCSAGQVQQKPISVKTSSESIVVAGTYSIGKDWSFSKKYAPPQSIPVPVVPMCNWD